MNQAGQAHKLQRNAAIAEERGLAGPVAGRNDYGRTREVVALERATAAAREG